MSKGIDTVNEITSQSNILSLFNPKPSGNLDTEEVSCVPCEALASMTALGFGTYLASGRMFTFKETGSKMTKTEFYRLNPTWWRGSVRGLGVGLLLYGAYRAREAYLLNEKLKQSQIE